MSLLAAKEDQLEKKMKEMTVFKAEDSNILQRKCTVEYSYCTENVSVSPNTVVKGTSNMWQQTGKCGWCLSL